MQQGFGAVTGALLCLPLIAGTLGAQPVSLRGYARLVSHELEVVEGCSGLLAAPPSVRKLTMAPGQPMPIPPPITCGVTTLRINRFRLTLPARTELGLFTGQQIAFDLPMQVSYDLSADWSGGLPVTIEAEVAATAGAAVGPCMDTLSANLSAQASRVCQWTSWSATFAEGFSLSSRFSYAPVSGTGPVWSVKSTARYVWTAAPAIERIEVVQAVQTEDQRVPLYTGRPTHVRVFPAGGNTETTRVQLEVKYGGGVWRTTAVRGVVVPLQVSRGSDAQSFLIPLPAEVVAAPGVIVMDAQLLTAEGRFIAPLARPVSVEIVEAPRALPLGYLRICESSADGRERVCPDAAAGAPQILSAVAEQILPVAFLPQTLLGTAIVPGGDGAGLRRMARLRQWLDDLQAGPAASVAAVLPSQGDWAARLTGRAGLRFAFTSDGPGAPEQLARALFALYGVPAFPVSGTSAGFDLRSGSVLPAGDPGWFGASTVEALAASLLPRTTTLPGAIEFLTVSGMIARDQSAGSLGHGFRSVASIAVPPSDPAAPTCVQLTVRGLHIGRPITPKVADALIVSVDDDEVRLAARLRDGAGSGRKKKTSA